MSLSNLNQKNNSINFQEKLGKIDQFWQPRVIAEMSDYQFKLAKIKGDFVWHSHEDTDETFIVIKGDLRIDCRDSCVQLSEGEMFVIPKGLEHKPFASRRGAYSSD